MNTITRLIITLGALILVLAVLAGIKGLQIGKMIAQGEAYEPPPETVTAEKVRAVTWHRELAAVGSLQAVQGVVVSAELAGRVSRISFQSGSRVKAGQVLVQQEISSEVAEEKAALSEVGVTKKNYERARALLPDKVIAQSSFDDAKNSYDKALARLDNIRAAIAKKTIKAPFSGRLGIRQVNLGEFLETGQPIVTLQTMDPIYVNFLMPQNRMPELEKGLPVRVKADSLDNLEIRGAITAINAVVDDATRNIRVQATLRNPDEKLRPGMFADVIVVLPGGNPVLVIPATAVHYAPYGDSVFVVEQSRTETGVRVQSIRQQFVQLGEIRGDLVEVIAGVAPDETVVSTGVFKLRNGQHVVVDNEYAPEFHLNLQPDNA